uniref:NnrU family protein, required for expression of nitric oxide and nitrite reductases (Nir and Nor) n=1 Tax=uncultured Thiotrichaceae bacterium TaxID=298394 RepID=A0A6S6UFU2_9GAMM|nr:MAG: NnrU family protein, required for expression of nitric oxide and nitrite reductases (Nir and Nor) [uncultured Thiotrichaceae bacterium]
MFWLILGVLLWTIVHLFPAVMADKRNQLNNAMGSKYQGGFAALIVLSLILIVVGWRSTPPEILYVPLSMGRHINMLFMLFAIILFASAHGKSKIKQFVRHPMLLGVHIWALGHLLANGETRSVVLFGGMLVWTILSFIFINKRDGEWVKPTESADTIGEIKFLVIALVAYLVLMFAHPYFAGMPVMG